VAKRLRLGRDGSGSVLDRDTAFVLTSDEWAMIQDLLTRAKYWEVPTEWRRDPNVEYVDGARWVLEAATPTRYHLVDRWSAATDPRDVAFTRLCLFLLDMSGLKPPDAEIY
jgi:hypothetical protein